MSLTTLLVLVSLYSDTATSLPKTSYLKLIDVWFIFSISFLSAVIAFHLATNRAEASPGAKTVAPVGAPPVAGTAKWRTSEHVFRMARVVYALVFFLFHIGYWSYTLQLAN
ncbi:acetylcholine-gated ion channel acc-4-like [Penaeus japonicus]|uniref:acetylcholine-gated ion channel acc-4-like n=1 Tax=Penaeus japonicus TaxID=27405 RepID=UPI001C716C4E|nr:acetylcholine-gated ion channel acc-4-like [Penaeus japonicus]